MIQIIKITLLEGMFAENAWDCTIEIPIDHSLAELHQAVQNAVGFDNDHMFEFCIANSYRSRNCQKYQCDDDAIFQITVGRILEQSKGKKLYYMFDYGDSWLFQLTRSRKKQFNADPEVFYPRVISENGSKPIQYPDWEE